MNSDFSKKLSLLRQERGVSQRTAAADLGISQALLSHYENGIREPGLPFVVRACDYYHVSADYILGRTLSKDGAMIASDEVYDPEAERTGVLKGSVLATLQNKLLSGAISVLFDLLGRLGDRDAVNAAGAYLGSAVYQLYRHLYRCAGRNEDYFSAEPDLFTLPGPLRPGPGAPAPGEEGVPGPVRRASPRGLSRPVPERDPGAPQHRHPPGRPDEGVRGGP